MFRLTPICVAAAVLALAVSQTHAQTVQTMPGGGVAYVPSYPPPTPAGTVVVYQPAPPQGSVVYQPVQMQGQAGTEAPATKQEQMKSGSGWALLGVFSFLFAAYVAIGCWFNRKNDGLVRHTHMYSH